MSKIIGEVFAFAGQSAPTNCMTCEGQQLLITNYTALYNVIGRSYTPTATPATHFNLPNLTGKVVVSNPTQIGATGGSDTIQIAQTNLPNISLTVEGDINIVGNEEDATSTEMNGMYLGNVNTVGNSPYNNEQPDLSIKLGGVSYSLFAPTGGNGTVMNIRNPFVNMLACICVNV